MAKKDSIIASVLAFEKKIVPSDGYMYETSWDDRNTASVPIHLVEKSVRGTISNRLKNAVKNDPVKLNAEVEKANLQTVDSASLAMDYDTLKLSFTIKVLPVQEPSACNNEEHYRRIGEMISAYKEKYGFKELAKRYAMNIANGRFLWRNRIGADKVEVSVKAKAIQKQWIFNAYDYKVNAFDAADEAVMELSEYISSALCGAIDAAFIEVDAYALLGKGQEVYPSEELILDKGRSRKSKVLYEADGTAAMHSQKLGNALRTIDTWYPDYADKPIAIEPYGAVTNLGKAYRPGTSKKDFYTLFDKYSVGEPLECEEDEHYVMAVLVRGGVFGQSGKE